MDPWAGAAAAIHARFADLQALVYTQAGIVLPPIRAVRSEDAAPSFPGAGGSLRKLTYEIRQIDLPDTPTKRDTFVHRGVLWRIEDVTRLDDVGAWALVVVDAGAAA